MNDDLLDDVDDETEDRVPRKVVRVPMMMADHLDGRGGDDDGGDDDEENEILRDGNGIAVDDAVRFAEREAAYFARKRALMDAWRRPTAAAGAERPELPVHDAAALREAREAAYERRCRELEDAWRRK